MAQNTELVEVLSPIVPGLLVTHPRVAFCDGKALVTAADAELLRGVPECFGLVLPEPKPKRKAGRP